MLEISEHSKVCIAGANVRAGYAYACSSTSHLVKTGDLTSRVKCGFQQGGTNSYMHVLVNELEPNLLDN